jgi:hypothetical protein
MCPSRWTSGWGRTGWKRIEVIKEKRGKRKEERENRKMGKGEEWRKAALGIAENPF